MLARGRLSHALRRVRSRCRRAPSAARLARLVVAPRVWPRRAAQARSRRPPSPLPARLTDAEFWRLSADLSEPNGYFPLRESRLERAHVPVRDPGADADGAARRRVPRRRARSELHLHRRRPGRAMAFIVDIRRGNLLAAPDVQGALRAVGRSRGVRLAAVLEAAAGRRSAPTSSVVELFTRVRRVRRRAKALYRQNLAAIEDHLAEAARLRALGRGPRSSSRRIYFAFFWEGPGLRYSTSRRSGIGGRGGFGAQLSRRYEELMMQTDWDGAAAQLSGDRGELPVPQGLRGEEPDRAGRRQLRRAEGAARGRPLRPRARRRRSRRSTCRTSSSICSRTGCSTRSRRNVATLPRRRHEHVHPIGLEPLRLSRRRHPGPTAAPARSIRSAPSSATSRPGGSAPTST